MRSTNIHHQRLLHSMNSAAGANWRSSINVIAHNNLTQFMRSIQQNNNAISKPPPPAPTANASVASSFLNINPTSSIKNAPSSIPGHGTYFFRSLSNRLEEIELLSKVDQRAAEGLYIQLLTHPPQSRDERFDILKIYRSWIRHIDYRAMPIEYFHVVLNSIIKRPDNPETVSKLFEDIRLFRIELTIESVGLLLRCCAQLKSSAETQATLRFFSRYIFDRGSSGGSALVGKFNSSLMNSWLESFAEKLDIQGMLLLFDEFKRYGVEADNKSYAILLQAFAKANMIDAAHSVLDSIIKQPATNDPTNIAYYCQLILVTSINNNNLNQAVQSFEKWKQLAAEKVTSAPEAQVFTLLIDAFVKLNSTESLLIAMELYKELRANNFIMDNNDSFNELLFGIGQHVQANELGLQTVLAIFKDRLQAFDSKETEIAPVISNFNTILQVVAHSIQHSTPAEESISQLLSLIPILLNEIDRLAIKSDTATYNALIESYGSAYNKLNSPQLYEQMINLYHTSKSLSITPNLQTYHNLMQYIKLDDFNQLLSDLLELKLIPTNKTFQLLLNSSSINNPSQTQLHRAKTLLQFLSQLLRDAPQYKEEAVPDATVWAAYFQHFAALPDISLLLQLLDLHQNTESAINQSQISSLFTARIQVEDFAGIYTVIAKLRRHGVIIESKTFQSLLSSINTSNKAQHGAAKAAEVTRDFITELRNHLIIPEEAVAADTRSAGYLNLYNLFLACCGNLDWISAGNVLDMIKNLGYNITLALFEKLWEALNKSFNRQANIKAPFSVTDYKQVAAIQQFLTESLLLFNRMKYWGLSASSETYTELLRHVLTNKPQQTIQIITQAEKNKIQLDMKFWLCVVDKLVACEEYCSQLDGADNLLAQTLFLHLNSNNIALEEKVIKRLYSAACNHNNIELAIHVWNYLLSIQTDLSELCNAILPDFSKMCLNNINLLQSAGNEPVKSVLPFLSACTDLNVDYIVNWMNSVYFHFQERDNLTHKSAEWQRAVYLNLFLIQAAAKHPHNNKILPLLSYIDTNKINLTEQMKLGAALLTAVKKKFPAKRLDEEDSKALATLQQRISDSKQSSHKLWSADPKINREIENCLMQPQPEPVALSQVNAMSEKSSELELREAKLLSTVARLEQYLVTLPNKIINTAVYDSELESLALAVALLDRSNPATEARFIRSLLSAIDHQGTLFHPIIDSILNSASAPILSRIYPLLQSNLLLFQSKLTPLMIRSFQKVFPELISNFTAQLTAIQAKAERNDDYNSYVASFDTLVVHTALSLWLRNVSQHRAHSNAAEQLVQQSLHSLIQCYTDLVLRGFELSAAQFNEVYRLLNNVTTIISICIEQSVSPSVVSKASSLIASPCTVITERYSSSSSFLHSVGYDLVNCCFETVKYAMQSSGVQLSSPPDNSTNSNINKNNEAATQPQLLRIKESVASLAALKLLYSLQRITTPGSSLTQQTDDLSPLQIVFNDLVKLLDTFPPNTAISPILYSFDLFQQWNNKQPNNEHKIQLLWKSLEVLFSTLELSSCPSAAALSLMDNIFLINSHHGLRIGDWRKLIPDYLTKQREPQFLLRFVNELRRREFPQDQAYSNNNIIVPENLLSAYLLNLNYTQQLGPHFDNNYRHIFLCVLSHEPQAAMQLLQLLEREKERVAASMLAIPMHLYSTALNYSLDFDISDLRASGWMKLASLFKQLNQRIAAGEAVDQAFSFSFVSKLFKIFAQERAASTIIQLAQTDQQQLASIAEVLAELFQFIPTHPAHADTKHYMAIVHCFIPIVDQSNLDHIHSIHSTIAQCLFNTIKASYKDCKVLSTTMSSALHKNLIELIIQLQVKELQEKQSKNERKEPPHLDSAHHITSGHKNSILSPEAQLFYLIYPTLLPANLSEQDIYSSALFVASRVYFTELLSGLPHFDRLSSVVSKLQGISDSSYRYLFSQLLISAAHARIVEVLQDDSKETNDSILLACKLCRSVLCPVLGVEFPFQSVPALLGKVSIKVTTGSHEASWLTIYEEISFNFLKSAMHEANEKARTRRLAELKVWLNFILLNSSKSSLYTILFPLLNYYFHAKNSNLCNTAEPVLALNYLLSYYNDYLYALSHHSTSLPINNLIHSVQLFEMIERLLLLTYSHQPLLSNPQYLLNLIKIYINSQQLHSYLVSEGVREQRSQASPLLLFPSNKIVALAKRPLGQQWKSFPNQRLAQLINIFFFAVASEPASVDSNGLNLLALQLFHLFVKTVQLNQIAQYIEPSEHHHSPNQFIQYILKSNLWLLDCLTPQQKISQANTQLFISPGIDYLILWLLEYYKVIHGNDRKAASLAAFNLKSQLQKFGVLEKKHVNLLRAATVLQLIYSTRGAAFSTNVYRYVDAIIKCFTLAEGIINRAIDRTVKDTGLQLKANDILLAIGCDKSSIALATVLLIHHFSRYLQQENTRIPLSADYATIRFEIMKAYFAPQRLKTLHLVDIEPMERIALAKAKFGAKSLANFANLSAAENSYALYLTFAETPVSRSLLLSNLSEYALNRLTLNLLQYPAPGREFRSELIFSAVDLLTQLIQRQLSIDWRIFKLFIQRYFTHFEDCEEELQRAAKFLIGPVLSYLNPELNSGKKFNFQQDFDESFGRSPSRKLLDIETDAVARLCLLRVAERMIEIDRTIPAPPKFSAISEAEVQAANNLPGEQEIVDEKASETVIKQENQANLTEIAERQDAWQWVRRKFGGFWKGKQEGSKGAGPEPIKPQPRSSPGGEHTAEMNDNNSSGKA
jgi:hypothetical protein